MATAQGRASLPLGGNAWNLEVQVNAADAFISESGTTIGEPFQAAGYLHLWKRNASSAWGLFAGIAPIDINLTSVGGEFAHYLPHASWGAALAYTNLSGLGESASAWTRQRQPQLLLQPQRSPGRSGNCGDAERGRIERDDLERHGRPRASLRHAAGERVCRGYLHQRGKRNRRDRGRRLPHLPRQAGLRPLQSHEKDVPFTFALPTLIL